jgi:hypothetical protein
MDRYVALTRELFFAGGNVKTFNNLVAMNRVKPCAEFRWRGEGAFWSASLVRNH